MLVTIHELGPLDGKIINIPPRYACYIIGGVAYTLEEYAERRHGQSARGTVFALVHPDLKRKMLGA